MEIEQNLRRYGATGFGYGWQEDQEVIEFIYKEKHIRFVLKLPARKAAASLVASKRGRATDARIEATHQQMIRQAWRALALAIKAKLEMVESGIATFEVEFLAHIVMPDNKTFAEHAIPAIERALSTAEPPRLMLGPGRSAGE